MVARRQLATIHAGLWACARAWPPRDPARTPPARRAWSPNARARGSCRGDRSPAPLGPRLTLTIFADGVENPANRARLDDTARLFGTSCETSITGRLIAVENVARATTIYGRRPLRGDATLAVGNERRGLSQRTLMAADEILVIPTQSRTVTTLNVAAAAAVAAWYVLRGSGPQGRARRPEARRPALLIAGDDHAEVGSSLRSAAAFGFHGVLLEDR
ncbi:MAG: RNA methyltransferase, partial [Chloroflexi bacterium]